MALTPKQIEEMDKKLKESAIANKKLLDHATVAAKQAEKLKSEAKDAKKELGTEKD